MESAYEITVRDTVSVNEDGGVHMKWEGGHSRVILTLSGPYAVAPELLEACKRLLDCPATNFDDLEDEDIAAIRQGREAIAKAEGTL